MSHVELRTARRARPLSLLVIVALTMSAASCGGGGQNASRSGEHAANANTGATADVAQQAPASKEVAAPGGYFKAEDLPRDEGGAGGERYAKIDENPFLEASRAPLSTFSIDVDTASYSNTRRFLSEGRLPPRDAVRIEELVNYFTYNYPQPDGPLPFSVTTEVADCPWNAQHRLVHIGLQGRTVSTEDLPPANLVFLVDVSGSMDSPASPPRTRACPSPSRSSGLSSA